MNLERGFDAWEAFREDGARDQSGGYRRRKSKVRTRD